MNTLSLQVPLILPMILTQRRKGGRMLETIGRGGHGLLSHLTSLCVFSLLFYLLNGLRQSPRNSLVACSKLSVLTLWGTYDTWSNTQPTKRQVLTQEPLIPGLKNWVYWPPDQTIMLLHPSGIEVGMDLFFNSVIVFFGFGTYFCHFLIFSLCWSSLFLIR